MEKATVKSFVNVGIWKSDYELKVSVNTGSRVRGSAADTESEDIGSSADWTDEGPEGLSVPWATAVE
jgi:hypothetical protein